MRITYLAFSLFLLLLIPVILPVQTFAKAPKRHNYVSVEMCKLCHKKKELGDQFDVWANTSHSKAFYTLGTPEAKEIAAKMGIKDPQQSNTCLRCHSTSHAFTEENVAEDLQMEDGVQCESCHGPGDEYMYLEVMEDLKEAKSMGLIMPTEETCRKCHNPESPTWNPERDTTPEGKKVGFCFSLRWKMIEHHKPLKGTKK
ncbi:MAG: cytochrome c family protein [Candidatus Brocadiales bacterium]|nr:cytochrome c family protein [Candidatus Brocadiales bacterium]